MVKERDKLIVALACMFLGVISSMSSGPLLALMVTIPFLLAYRYRSHWKIGILIIVMGCTFIEIISNRHFWETIDRFTFSSKTAWYRTRLIEVALFEDGMTDHWLAGHGLDDPGWSMKIDLRSHTDMVNHYILILSRYGLIGFIPFMLMLKRAAKSLICAIKHANSHPDRWLAWTLAGAFLGLLASLFSVSLFGPPITMFYLLLSFCPVVERIVNQENAKLLTLEELDEETAIEKGVFT